MALIKCPNCGKEYSQYADRCPLCGLTMDEAEQASILKRAEKTRSVKKKLKIVFIAGLVVLGIVAVIISVQRIMEKVESSSDSVIEDSSIAIIKENNEIRKTYMDATFTFEIAGSFSEGMAPVKLNRELGFINTEGTVLIPFTNEYDLLVQSSHFSEGLFPLKKDGKMGFINKTGEVVIPFAYETNDFASFSEGLFPVNKNGKMGYIDTTGKVVIPFIYDDAWTFSEGLAVVVKNGKRGCIDKTGRMVIPYGRDFFMSSSFSEGLCCIGHSESGKYGYIDKSGKIVIPCIYNFIHDFHDGVAYVQLDAENAYKNVYINKMGEIVFSSSSEDHSDLSFRDGLARVTKRGKVGFVDNTGKEVIPCMFTSAGNFSEGLAVVSLYSKYGYIDKTGQIVIPMIFDYAEAFSEGLACVAKNNGDGSMNSMRYGFIDKTGRVVIPRINQ